MRLLSIHVLDSSEPPPPLPLQMWQRRKEQTGYSPCHLSPPLPPNPPTSFTAALELPTRACIRNASCLHRMFAAASPPNSGRPPPPLPEGLESASFEIMTPAPCSHLRVSDGPPGRLIIHAPPMILSPLCSARLPLPLPPSCLQTATTLNPAPTHVRTCVWSSALSYRQMCVYGVNTIWPTTT